MVEEHGVELRKLPDDVLITLRQISDQVVSELAESDEVTRHIYESYKSFQEGVEHYHNIAEEAYVEARKLPINQ